MSARVFSEDAEKPGLLMRAWDAVIDNDCTIDNDCSIGNNCTIGNDCLIEGNCVIDGTLTLSNIPSIPVGAANSVFSSNGTTNGFRVNPRVDNISFTNAAAANGNTITYFAQETLSLGVTYTPDSFESTATVTFTRINGLVTCCIQGTVAHAVVTGGGILVLGNIPTNFLPAANGETAIIFGLGSTALGATNTTPGAQLVRVYKGDASPDRTNKIVLSYDSQPATQSLSFTEVSFSYRCA